MWHDDYSAADTDADMLTDLGFFAAILSCCGILALLLVLL